MQLAPWLRCYCVSMLSEMSSAATECVSAPTLTKSTPVAAMARALARDTLPEASVSASPPIRDTACAEGHKHGAARSQRGKRS
jgi:hypothetical protein